jgi:hypothetical protein
MDNNRLNYKTNANIFKDNDYETDMNILKDLLPFIEKYNIIYDPFYCNGFVIKEWEKLGKKCINEKKNAFDRETPNMDICITNPPFDSKEKCIKLLLSFNKPFIILFPIDTLGSKWIKKYFDKLQFIIPNGRYNFYKNGEKTKSCWFDTMWICYNINLKHNIIKI